jgi:hypothetical protein
MSTVKRTFSPIKDGRPLKPEEYMMEYPELTRRDETKNMRGIELMWCWYYASNESIYVKDKKSHKDRCGSVTDLVFKKINKNRSYEIDKIELLKDGVIPRDWSRAIEFFKSRDTETRSRAKDIIDKMFDEYEKVVELGIEGFKVVDKDGNSTIDYNKFSTTMRSIKAELDDLVKKKEEGFGVSTHFIGLNESETEGDYWNRLYLKLKQ